MHPVSMGYLTHINSSLSRVPQSKIIFSGGTEILGDVIKSTPKITHQNTSFIGGFPAKKCTFEIYDFGGGLDLNGQWIRVFRGLEFDGVTEWVPMGIFAATPENIKNNVSSRSISFTGTDRSTLFDTRYESALDWGQPHTGHEIIEEICTRLGVPLETPGFNFALHVWDDPPNIPAVMTYREVVSRMAEIGGEIAYISRAGGLVIKGPTPTGIRISRTKYEKLSKENLYGPINQLSLGHKDYEDAVLEPLNVPDAKTWRIDDNPFVDLIREQIILNVFVLAKLDSRSIIPFEMIGCVDDFILDLNDTIEIEDKDGNYFESTVLEINNTARIKSTVRASTQGGKAVDVPLAGSTAEKINQVSLRVDHNLNTITATIYEITEGMGNVSSIIEQHANKIRQEVSEEYATKDDLVDELQRNAADLQLMADNLLLNFYALQSYTETVEGTLSQYMQEVATWIRFGLDGMTMGKVDSPFTSQLSEQMLAFLQNGQIVSYFSDNKQYITNAEITNSLVLGKYAFIPRDNGNTSFKWIG